jgi:protein-disulfide isomerase
VSVAALMVSAFFGGYIFHDRIGISQQSTGGAVPLQQLQPGGGVGAAAPSPAGAPTQPQAPVKVSQVSIDGDPVKGNPNAQVTMVEFSDFQCPFCGRFSSDALPQIQKDYIDTGKIKFVYKQFPMDNLHPNAKAAAVASECANEQGKFWQYHDKLFSTQTAWENQPATDVTNTFKKYATDMGLNAASFNSCLDTKKTASAVDKDSQQASQYGVSGTPTFYIGNDKKGYLQLVGAQPYQSFKSIIDQQLSSPA